MQIERGPGRGFSQAPLGPGWAGKRPKIDDFRSYPHPEKPKKHDDCIGDKLELVSQPAPHHAGLTSGSNIGAGRVRLRTGASVR